MAAHLTDEEFLNLPDEPGRQELLDGDLIESPPAKYRHSLLVMAFYDLFRTFVDPARVRPGAGYRLKPRGWLQPDVSVTWPDQPVDDWLLGSPMLAIEIADRDNTAEEVDRKISAYLKEGAAEVWIVYPETRSMMVFCQESVQRITASYYSEALSATIDLPALLKD